MYVCTRALVCAHVCLFLRSLYSIQNPGALEDKSFSLGSVEKKKKTSTKGTPYFFCVFWFSFFLARHCHHCFQVSYFQHSILKLFFPPRCRRTSRVSRYLPRRYRVIRNPQRRKWAFSLQSLPRHRRCATAVFMCRSRRPSNQTECK